MIKKKKKKKKKKNKFDELQLTLPSFESLAYFSEAKKLNV